MQPLTQIGKHFGGHRGFRSVFSDDFVLTECGGPTVAVDEVTEKARIGVCSASEYSLVEEHRVVNLWWIAKDYSRPASQFEIQKRSCYAKYPSQYVDEMLSTDVVTWTALITAYSKHDRPQDALVFSLKR
ncbi:hypothetical protein NC651_034649 [Populus alba x Populus x berolinensis]|nr:hypothetical protein NC651_034641 [Populus alba x Populus x berolinensis]KAJ6863896.1 hypothetical protein NC651_034649 [Populus alba x Populus x berolinensis]